MRNLILTVLVTALLPALVWITLLSRVDQDSHELTQTAIKQQGLAVAHAIALSYDLRQATFDPQPQQLERMQMMPNVATIWVLDAQGWPLATAGDFDIRADLLQRIAGARLDMVRQGPVWLVAYPLFYADQRRGSIIIGLTPNTLVGERSSKQNDLIFGALGILVFSLILSGAWWLYSRRNQAASTELDIEQQELKRAMESGYKQLQGSIAQQKKALSDARKEAIKANELKSQFLANMSHEIRTPLNAIIGFTDLLLKTDLNSRQQDYLNTVRKSSSSLLQILNDILDFSKIEAGKLQFEHVAMDLRETVDDVLAVMAAAADAKQIELVSIIYPNVPCQLLGDPLRIKQILTNLISNGIKFTERGSISIRISLEYRSRQRVKLKFSVVDSGIGITPEQQQKLFQAFSQADTSTSRQYGGTGLGLTITKNLVEQMKGEIGVESKPGSGANFWFTLEVKIVEESTAELPPIPCNVALFDKHPLARASLTQLLQAWNIGVNSAHSLKALVRKVQEDKQIDLAIISLGFAIRSRDEAIDQLKALSSATDRPVILLYNSMQSDEIYALMTEHASMTLAKPIRYKELYNALTSVLGLPQQAAIIPPIADQTQVVFSSTPKILAVDDNPDNLKLIRTLLEDLGVDVSDAGNGEDALTLLNQKPFDLVLTDIQMPGMDGLELAQRVRRFPGVNRDVPIIAVTAHLVDGQEDDFIAAGMDGYLIKPASSEQLVETILHQTHIKCVPQPVAPVSQAQTQIQAKAPATTAKAPLSVVPDQTAASKTDDDRSDNHNKVVDIALGIQRAAGKTDLAQDLFKRLVASLENDKAEIANAWSLKDFDTLLHQVHRLHGATKYCGVPALQAACQVAETHLKKSEFNQLPSAIDTLFEQIAAVELWASQARQWETGEGG